MNKKTFDLEDRTFIFAKKVRKFSKKIKINIYNLDDIKQLIRSSGSIGANYIEANESLSKKDFYHRIKICRKEAKETTYWLKLLELEPLLEKTRKSFINESEQLTKIFGSIISNQSNS